MLEAVVVAAYLSYFIEILVFPVPSVASSYQLLFPRPGGHAGDTALSESQSLSPVKRLVFFAAPTALCIVLFAIPPLVLLFPNGRTWLLLVESLESTTIQGLGVILICLGRYWTFRSVIHMRGGFSKPFRPVRSQPLRSGKSFQRSRNPGLLGMYIFYVGLTLAFPSLWLIIGFPVYLANMHTRVLLEESDLSARFGEAFAVYRQSTARYW